MSVLSTIQKPDDRPIFMTICGDAGMGKTRLAAAFPKPIFVRAEDGLQSIPADERPDAFPVVNKASDLWDQLMALVNEDHDYKTLVIDPVTALERLFVEDVMARDQKAQSINQAFGGFGAGTSAVAAMHGRVRKAAGVLNERKNMHVIFVAHATTETMQPPEHDDYMRYCLRMPEKSIPPYLDDVDIVGFLRLQSAVMGDDDKRKKAVSTGQRELITYVTPSNVSKNRFGITKSLPFEAGENPLVGLVPTLIGDNAEAKDFNGWDANKPETTETEES